MANYVWDPERDLMDRYDAPDVEQEGARAWRRFLETLLAGHDEAEALSELILTLQGLPDRTMAQPRIFISHRRVDVAYAERIAWLASQRAGLEYWLDVHDPTLRLANVTIPATSPRYAVIIAAIIEMALLNCTHVIAAHTPPPAPLLPWIPSQWISYEFARAKSRKVYSKQAAGWFHPAVRPPESRGEYVLLADRCLSDPDVEQWLVSRGSPTNPKAYRGGHGPPNALP